MTTEYNNEDDPYLRPYRPDLEDESDEDDESDDLVTDLDEAAAEFRMRYYGPDNNPQPPAAMVELAPEVMRLVDAVVYGEIYNRPAVDLKTRSLCTIAALVVLGHSPQMIKRHITGRAAYRRHRGRNLGNHRADGVLRRDASGGERLSHSQGDLRRAGGRHPGCTPAVPPRWWKFPQRFCAAVPAGECRRLRP